MKIKEVLVSFGLAVLTMWGVNYFLGGLNRAEDLSKSATSGQRFVAPKEFQELTPLNKEVDFIDVRRPGEPVITEIETHGALYQFSSEGASLERFEVKRRPGDVVATIFPPVETERERRCFLVALEEKTPFYYKLEAQNKTETGYELIYRAETNAVVIYKKYTVHDAVYRVDLELAVKPKGGATVLPRIFFPTPIVPDVAAQDVISGIYNNEKGAIEKTVRKSIDWQQGWFRPTFFGIENRYFVHAMFSDPAGFIQRAYYSSVDRIFMFAILEGKPVSTDTSWQLSFYLGPKEQQAFASVDQRLGQTLDHLSGIILGPLSRGVLHLLQLLHSFVYNYGLAIILLTLLIKLILLPFSLKAEAGKKKGAEYTKKLKYLQQRYRNDPDALARERAGMLKKHGMPGMIGCLPMLLQLPIFFALSTVLSNSIEFYHEPFFGWIYDLSKPDPYYVLPLLIAAGMLVQAATANKQQRLTFLIMALVSGAFGVNFSAGLALYILINALFTVVQTFLTNQMRLFLR